MKDTLRSLGKCLLINLMTNFYLQRSWSLTSKFGRYEMILYLEMWLQLLLMSYQLLLSTSMKLLCIRLLLGEVILKPILPPSSGYLPATTLSRLILMVLSKEGLLQDDSHSEIVKVMWFLLLQYVWKVAKATALRDSLVKARDRGYMNVQVEGASKLVIDAINGKLCPPWRLRKIVQDIRTIASSFSLVWFYHVYI